MSDFLVFIENFERLCRDKGLSPSAALMSAGFSNSAYSYWKKTETIPRMSSLAKIADFFGVSVKELLAGTEGNTVKTFGSKPVTITNRLPIYGVVSAGPGALAFEEVLGYEFADERYHEPEYFWLEVSGDSMSPKIDDGDLVLVHKQDWIDSGQVGVFVVGEDAYVKKIEFYNDELDLISYNPYYPPLRFPPDEADRVHVIGRVIELKRKYV